MIDFSREDLIHVLKKHWGYDSFRPCQEDIIQSILTGHDTLGLMPTGGGKSLTFQVPAMLLKGLTIVVTPLISLMKDQVDNLKARNIPAAYLCTGVTRREEELVLEKALYGKIKLLYLSPEKLASVRFLSKIETLPVNLIVADEAHCISQWGYDFRPQYLKLGEMRNRFEGVPVLALTASATEEVSEDIRKQLQFKKGNQTFRLSFKRPNISYLVRHTEDKISTMTKILTAVDGSAIIYVRSRKKTHEYADALCKAGFSADCYHAGLDPEDKTERQNRWKSGDTRIIVATNAFGMGIDKPDVRLVLHVDLPPSLEEYYQEAGRAGRDGNPSYAVLILSKKDRGSLDRKLAASFPVAFTGCTKRNEKLIKIPSSVQWKGRQYTVTAIAKKACKGYPKLKKVTIGNQVQSVGNAAFMNCKKLRHIIYGKSVSYIGKNGLRGDRSLQSVTIKSRKLKSVGKAAFRNLPAALVVKVPKKQIKNYRILIQKAK